MAKRFTLAVQGTVKDGRATVTVPQQPMPILVGVAGVSGKLLTIEQKGDISTEFPLLRHKTTKTPEGHVNMVKRVKPMKPDGAQVIPVPGDPSTEYVMEPSCEGPDAELSFEVSPGAELSAVFDGAKKGDTVTFQFTVGI